MTIIPPGVENLVDAYNDLQTTAEDIFGAVSRIAPAAAREVLCDIGGLASLGAGPLARFQGPGTGERLLSDIGGILQAACPVPPPPPEEPQPLEGQCPGVLYTVNYTLQRKNRLNCSQATEVVGSATLEGPINNFGFTTPDTSTCDFGGTPWIRFEALTGPAQTPTLIRGSSGNLRWSEFQIDSIIRQDGLPDDCGEVPPTAPRPPITQPPRSPDIPRVDPDGNPLPPVFFEPRVGPIFIGPEGGINIPVIVNIGGPSFETAVSIPVTVSLPDFAPTINFGGGGGGLGEGQPVEPQPPQGICCQPPPPVTAPGQEEDPEEPPPPEEPNLVIIGVAVTTREVSDVASATIIGTAQPPLRVPRIATVQFGVGGGDAEFISKDTQIKQFLQYVEAPPGVPITRAFIRWEPGFDGEFSYVYEPVNSPGLPSEP